MFTLPFWIVFALGILVSLGISVVYGRRAIHPRLRPHFGLVVVVFLIMTLASFFIAIVLGKIAGGGMEDFDQNKARETESDTKQPPVRRVEEKPDPGL